MNAHQLFFVAVLVAACAYGGVRGGQPERIVAAAFLIAAPLTLLGRLLGRHTYHALELEVVAVDVALFVALTAVALCSARFWPMPMASMQGAELLAHIAKPLGTGVLPEAYYAIVAFWSYPMLALLIVGTIRHRRRLALYHVDYAWAAALPPAYRAGGIAGDR